MTADAKSKYLEMSFADLSGTLFRSGIGLWEIAFEADDLTAASLSFNKSFQNLVCGCDEYDGPVDLRKFVERWCHPDETGIIFTNLLNLIRGDAEYYRVEHRFWNKGKQDWRWFQSNGDLCRPQGGLPRRVRGVVIKTHERRMTNHDLEKALEKNKTTAHELKLERERLSTVIDAAALGTWDWNIQTGEVIYSPRWAEIIGYKLDEIEQTVETWEAALVPEDLDLANAAIEAHCNGLTPQYEADFRMRHKNGSIIWAQDRGRVVEYDEHGQAVRLMGVLIDVTRQKSIEQALAENKDQLELVFNAARIGAWDWDLTRGTIKFNNVYLDMLGYTQDEIKGTIEEWESFVHPDELEAVNAALDRLVKGEDPDYAMEIRMKHKDGHYVWTYDFGRVVEWNEKGEALRVVGGHFDFDEKKKMEFEFFAMQEQERGLKLARDLAEESARAKSNFLANMSHEIRTPMNAILGLTHLALQTELDEQQLEYIQRTETAAKALLRIINDILDFSKIEAGKMEMEDVDFRLDELVRSAVDLLVDQAHEKGLEFILDIPANLPNNLVGDPVRLNQILSNLISNAIKFTQTGAVALRVALVENDGTTVLLRFTVKDSGIGLTSDQISKLFSAFTQADASTTRKYGGTGLGLAISKRLIEIMGGEIWCDSLPNQGSTFGFTARFKLGRPGEEAEAAPAVSKDVLRGLTALLVDDSPLALEILEQAMLFVGFKVQTASSGEEALNLLAGAKDDHKFDLVMVDWKMPGLDGVELIRRMNEMIVPEKLPAVLMVTAYDKNEVAEKSREVGIRHVLAKPISPSTLYDALMDVFGSRHRKKQASKAGRGKEVDMVKPIQGARILLTEDNEVNQLVASRILRNAGFEVDIANNGREALERVQQKDFDLVLMDVQMPEIDGLTAASRIRAMEKFKTLPIVAMTAHAMSGDKELSLKAGMNDHVNKPINITELFQALLKWIPPKR
ncbi:MAG: PAS domain-containing protein [Candidatus Adiutrix sp.]|jgi:PAS domain S-box-containing protein|nr:PAS domain-containing protein [Candidatus Adiutrix sp.]